MIWGLPVVEAMRDNIGAKKLWFLVPFYCKGTRLKPNIYQDRLGTNAKQLDFEQTRFVHFLLSGGEMEGAVKVGLWLSSSLPFGCGTRRMVSDILLKGGCAQLDFERDF